MFAICSYVPLLYYYRAQDELLDLFLLQLRVHELCRWGVCKCAVLDSAREMDGIRKSAQVPDLFKSQITGTRSPPPWCREAGNHLW